MKIYPVVKQLQTYLPKYTTLFSDGFSVSSLTSSGTLVTVVTTTPNPFVTGDSIQITGALIDIPITNLDSVNNLAYATTNVDHDLTLGWNRTVTVSGCDQDEYNGTFELVDVPNRLNFTYKLNGIATNPTTGTPVLVDNYSQGYNGFQIITVINNTTFTYTVPYPLLSPAYGNIMALGRNRISGAISIDRALESYTKQPNSTAWLFVVPGATTANKDRYTQSDATYEASNTTMYWQMLIDSISVYAIVPTVDSIAARQEWDLLQDQALIPLLKTLCGTKFETNLDEKPWSRMTFVSADFYGYTKAYYIHEYNFEWLRDLTYSDLIIGNTRAFRDIDITFLEDGSFESATLMTAAIDLDNVPLED